MSQGRPEGQICHTEARLRPKYAEMARGSSRERSVCFGDNHARARGLHSSRQLAPRERSNEVQPMVVDRTNFLLIAAALAAGGVAGWAYRDRDANAARLAVAIANPPGKASATPPTGPIAVSVVDSTALPPPVCDDSQGTPEECPSMGPAEEGACANVIHKRCQEFKAAFEPKVASLAVACLRALKPGERCDAARINQCGHLALMAACPDPAPAVKAQLQNAHGSSEPPTVTIALDPATPASAVTTACESILKTCGNQPLSPTLSDCRQTLAGLNDLGRTNIVECVTAHCTDRGLYGCEAVPKAQIVARANGSR
jgi:hypothetical protein